MKHRSRYADLEAACAAVSLALPSIEQALQSPDVSGRGVLHLVVLDPAAPATTCDFEEAVLYEHSVGDRSQWDVDYAAYARDKAQLSWRHEMDSRRLVHLAPHRLSQQETLLWGACGSMASSSPPAVPCPPGTRRFRSAWRAT